MPDRHTMPPVSAREKPLPARGLLALIAALSESERVELAERTRVQLDEGKRIGSDQQLARALVTRPELKTLRGLSAAERAVVFTLAQAQVQSPFEPQVLPATLFDAAQALLNRGWVFGVPGQSLAGESGQHVPKLVLPLAFVLQVPAWEGEEPLALRRLLSAQLSSPQGVEVCSGIVRYFGGPVLPPWALGLELAYGALSDPIELQAQLRGLGDAETRLLREICRLGGEIESSELLDLEREPLRLSGAWGVSTQRRGVSYELERRALLLPLGSNRYAVPAEVHALVSAPERGRAALERQRLWQLIVDAPIEPLRAQFSRDPVPLVLAMALLAQQREGLRVNVGTPRSMSLSLGRSLGLEPDVAVLFAVLGRSLGLWSPPEAWRDLGQVAELYPRVLQAWAQGAAWDLGRVEPEVLRATASSRAPSPARDVVGALIDAAKDVGVDRWVSLEALGQLVRRDPRLVNIDARLERWAKRLGLAVPETGVVIARALEDLFALGVLDRVAAGDPSLAVRVGARARALWFDGDAKRDDSALRDLGPLRFGVGPSTKIADVLRASAILEPTELGPELGLVVSAERIEQLALAGRTEADLRAWLEPLGAWSTATQALVVDATRARNQLDFAPAAGFVWIEDSALREQLRTQPGLAGLFVDPSPQMGLLVRAGVSLERLVKACRSRSIALRLLDDAGSARLVAENKARKVGRPRQRPAR